MTPAAKNLIRFYSVLLSVYPRHFKREFAAEIEHTFAAALEDAIRSGRREIYKTCLRELRDYLPNLLIAYLDEGGLAMDRILAQKNPLRSVQAGAIGFGVGFLVMGLVTALLVLSQQSLAAPVLSLLYFLDFILTSILIGAAGGAVMGYGFDPQKVKRFAFLCAAGYLLGTFITSDFFIGLLGIKLYQSYWETILIFASPFVAGAVMGAFLSRIRELRQKPLLLVAMSAVSFEVGWLLNRLSLWVMNAIWTAFGAPFPPNSKVWFVMTWMIAYAIYGMAAGSLLGIMVGRPMRDTTEKSPLLSA